MKLKRCLLAFVGLFALALAACSNTTGGNTTASTPLQPGTSEGTTTEQTPATDLLTFVGNNKVRVDIMNENLGVRFSYGNEAITSKTDMTLNASSNLSASGTLAVETINFVIVTVNATSTSVFISKEILKDSFSDYMSKILQSYFTGATKVYVAISTGEVNWTHNLNAELDAKISAGIPK